MPSHSREAGDRGERQWGLGQGGSDLGLGGCIGRRGGARPSGNLCVCLREKLPTVRLGPRDKEDFLEEVGSM